MAVVDNAWTTDAAGLALLGITRDEGPALACDGIAHADDPEEPAISRQQSLRTAGASFRRDRCSGRPACVSEALRVEITDNGPGVRRPDRFFGPSCTTQKTGASMAFAICRRIVEPHGAPLRAGRSTAGEATFAFTLPIQADEAS